MAKKKQKVPEKKSRPKTIYIVISVIAILALVIYFLNTGPAEDQNFPAGVYTKLNKPGYSEPGKVRIMEFLKFDCSHCYDLHKNLPQLLQKYEGKVQITYVPIVFQKQSTKSIEAYNISEQMGKGEEMKDALFKAKFENGMDVMESTIALKTVGEKIGLGADFNQKLESGAAKNAAIENLRLMNDYGVDGTPTIIINGNLVVAPTIQNLDTVIGSLLSNP